MFIELSLIRKLLPSCIGSLRLSVGKPRLMCAWVMNVQYSRATLQTCRLTLLCV